MNRILLALVLGAAIATGGGCGVEVSPAYPGVYVDYPPDAYIGTADPFYYGGYANYYYGGRWYYRNGGRWNHYEHEPRTLHDHRSRAAPARHSYERARPASRSAGHAGGGRR